MLFTPPSLTLRSQTSSTTRTSRTSTVTRRAPCCRSGSSSTRRWRNWRWRPSAGTPATWTCSRSDTARVSHSPAPLRPSEWAGNPPLCTPLSPHPRYMDLFAVGHGSCERPPPPTAPPTPHSHSPPPIPLSSIVSTVLLFGHRKGLLCVEREYFVLSESTLCWARVLCVEREYFVLSESTLCWARVLCVEREYTVLRRRLHEAEQRDGADVQPEEPVVPRLHLQHGQRCDEPRPAPSASVHHRGRLLRRQRRRLQPDRGRDAAAVPQHGEDGQAHGPRLAGGWS